MDTLISMKLVLPCGWFDNYRDRPHGHIKWLGCINIK